MSKAIETIVDSGMKIFENSEFGSVRTALIDDEPWFVGKDVAKALGYSNTRDALAKHVDDEDKNSVAIHDGIPGNPNQVVINESGVYSLVFSSKLPDARKFKHWVTAEVLPTIRKAGSYSIKGTEQQENEYAMSIMRDYRKMAEVFTRLADAEDKNVRLEADNQRLTEANEELTPLANYAGNVLSCQNAKPIMEIAKEFGWTAQQMNKFLHDKGVQYWNGRMWLLYAKYDDEGYTKTETCYYYTQAGYQSRTSTKWTEKGRYFIHNLMEKNGYVPGGTVNTAIRSRNEQTRFYDAVRG